MGIDIKKTSKESIERELLLEARATIIEKYINKQNVITNERKKELLQEIGLLTVMLKL